MDKLRYIVEKKTISLLVFVFDKTSVPQWLMDVIDTIAEQYPESKISAYLVEGNQKTTTYWNRIKQFLFIPFIIVEKLVFRQEFKSMNGCELKQIAQKFKNFELIDCRPDNSSQIKTDNDTVVISFVKSVADIQPAATIYEFSSELISYGREGILAFLYNHRYLKRVFQVRKVMADHDELVWDHRFQTLSYGLDKNIGYLKAAVKQSIITLWRSRYRNIQTDRGDYVPERKWVFFPLFIYWIGDILGRLQRKTVKTIFHKRWGLILIPRNQDGETKLKVLLPKGKDGRADPFIIEEDKRKHLFFETIDASSQRGYLETAELNGRPELHTIRKIVKEGFHLSYPHVFKKNDEWWMIPESSADKSLRLYKSAEFPHQWEYQGNIIAGERLLDCTPFWHEGIWWIFTIIKTADDAGSYDQLYLFYTSDLLLKPWYPHPQNPVVTDSASARPAGKLFWRDGFLIRPSQDCYTDYGAAIRLNRVIKLTKQAYQEECIQVITPASLKLKATGVHTYNHSESYEVLDGMFNTSRM